RSLALHRLAVNGDDAVAEPQAGAEGRRALEGGEDVGVGVLADLAVADGRADAVVLRAPVGALILELFRVVVVRVRVERAQHADNGGLEDVVVVELVAVNVVVLDDGQSLGHVRLDGLGGLDARASRGARTRRGRAGGRRRGTAAGRRHNWRT